MSRAKPSVASWIGWIISLLLVAGSIWLWLERQYVVDLVQYNQFKPTAAIESVVSDAGLTDDATFTFYATRPAIESKNAFNGHCQRKEADSPILGCYSANRIYIYDVTDERLSGIKTVTAAHELLHAEYDRLPVTEKQKIDRLLQAEYEKVDDEDLDARMKYYEKTEPGQSINELHSIIGTEFPDINPELEQYYGKYFRDRQNIVMIHTNVQTPFKELSEEADALVDQIEKLNFKVTNDKKEYDRLIEGLNKDVDSYNQRAASSDGFTTQAEADAERGKLIQRGNQLNALRQTILSSINQQKILLARLDKINAESASLNQSLDSVLSDVPTI